MSTMTSQWPSAVLFFHKSAVDLRNVVGTAVVAKPWTGIGTAAVFGASPSLLAAILPGSLARLR